MKSISDILFFKIISIDYESITLLFILFLLFISFNQTKVDVTLNDLPDCIVLIHSVRESFKVNDLEKAFNKQLI